MLESPLPHDIIQVLEQTSLDQGSNIGFLAGVSVALLVGNILRLVLESNEYIDDPEKISEKVRNINPNIF